MTNVIQFPITVSQKLKQLGFPMVEDSHPDEDVVVAVCPSLLWSIMNILDDHVNNISDEDIAIVNEFEAWIVEQVETNNEGQTIFDMAPLCRWENGKLVPVERRG